MSISAVLVQVKGKNKAKTTISATHKGIFIGINSKENTEIWLLSFSMWDTCSLICIQLSIVLPAYKLEITSTLWIKQTLKHIINLGLAPSCTLVWTHSEQADQGAVQTNCMHYPQSVLFARCYRAQCVYPQLLGKLASQHARRYRDNNRRPVSAAALAVLTQFELRGQATF